MVVATADQAVQNANSYTHCDPGMCLAYVRTWLEIPSLEPRAIDAWNNAKYKHPGNMFPPRGAPVYWASSATGSGAGHIALCKGDSIRTTDKPTGTVANDDGSWPHNQWGQTYLGWSEDLNGIWLPYFKNSNGGQDWRASGDVYVSKLVRGQQNSDSVSRLRFRLEHHERMPDSKKPGYGNDYGEKVQVASKYWMNNIDPQRGTVSSDKKQGDDWGNAQANRLFGDNYTVIGE